MKIGKRWTKGLYLCYIDNKGILACLYYVYETFHHPYDKGFVSCFHCWETKTLIWWCLCVHSSCLMSYLFEI